MNSDHQRSMKLESVRRLEKTGISYRLVELREKAFTVEDVVKFAKDKINRDEICKTIILKDDDGNKYAVLLLGKHRIDFSKMRVAVGRKLSIANYKEVTKETGTEPGAVCPLVLNIPLYIDKRVLDKERVNFGSGNHLYGLEISPRDFDRVIEFKVIDFASTIQS